MQVDSRVPERDARPHNLTSSVPEAAAVLVGVLFLFPVSYLVWSTFDLGADLWATLTNRSTLLPLRNSLVIATCVSAACGLLGGTLAWITTRTDTPGNRLWRAILPLPLVIPSFVGATALLATFGRGGLIPLVPRLNGFAGAFVVLTLLSYPYVYLPTVARLRSTIPQLEEAARVLDGSFRKTARHIVVPQIKGTVTAGMLLVFLYVLSDFGAVSLMRYDTITRAIFSARLSDRPTSLTLGLTLAVLAIAVAAAERSLSDPGATDGTRGHQVRYALGKWKWSGAALVITTVGAGFIAPIVVFLIWVVRGSTTIGIGYSGLGDDLTFLGGPIVNSVVAGVAAAVAAAVIVLPVAYVSARRRGWVGDFSSAAVSSVFALPGLVVALALVFWAIRAPGMLAGLHQTFPLLILAYVLHFGTQSMATTRASVAALAPALSEAAHTLGASRTRRFVTVELPLIAPGLIAGAGLVMLSTLKELPATLLLAPIGFQTLATKIWGAAEDGFFAEVGITSLVLIAMSWALTWVLVLRETKSVP